MGTYLLIALNAFGDDSPVEVQPVSGSTVMVSPSEIKRAYLELVQRKSKNADSVVANEDGSVAITRPTFSYNGKLLRVDANFTSAQGVCKRFGFGTTVGNEPQRVDADATVAILSKDGKLSDLIPAYPGMQRSVLETVACQ